MSFEPATLELFVRIAALGAFAKAGREFGLSPTAATQRIKGLENELGVQLFNRTTRAVSLTPDGETFLGHAKRILTDIEDARSDLAGGGKNIKGELRITGPVSLRPYVTPVIAQFLETYPDVRVRLEITDARIDLVEHGIDLALRIGQLPSSTLIARKLADNPRCLMASPNYLARAGTPTSPQDLTHHNCITTSWMNTWHLRDTSGIVHDVHVSGSFVTNFGDAITEGALSDIGIGLKTLRDVRPHLDAGTLVTVLDDYTLVPEAALWAVRPPSDMVPARVRAFIDFLALKFQTLESGTD